MTNPAESESADAAPKLAIPSPAVFAQSHRAPDRTAFGRVDESGVVYVTTADGERPVGSYPGASRAEALAYFGRKYDDLLAAVDLLHQRVTQTDISVKEAQESHEKLTQQVADANVVGDLAALEQRVDEVRQAVDAKRQAESAQRAAARQAAQVKREQIVREAEQIVAQPGQRIQWKTSGARMQELLAAWKASQRSGPRLEHETEAALWQRLSAARNGFDRARRIHFAQLDSAQAEAKRAKERLVAEAEKLATSRDWATTASSFKRLMDQWRAAGRASRADDEALWQRFKAAQDTFFAAKDQVVAAEEQTFRDNLKAKEALLTEATAILPVTDLEQAKTALRAVQDKWEKVGKVPRADLERTEKALRKVEQAVRGADEKRWSSSNPEAAARARSLVEQLEAAVADLQADLDKAQASGDQRKTEQAREALQAREQWLAQARSGLREFTG